MRILLWYDDMKKKRDICEWFIFHHFFINNYATDGAVHYYYIPWYYCILAFIISLFGIIPPTLINNYCTWKVCVARCILIFVRSYRWRVILPHLVVVFWTGGAVIVANGMLKLIVWLSGTLSPPRWKGGNEKRGERILRPHEPQTRKNRRRRLRTWFPCGKRKR